MRFAQALEQSKWFRLPGLHCEKVLHKRFARMEGAVFEVHFLVDPVDWVDSYLPKLHSMILRVINKNQLIGEIYIYILFLSFSSWSFLKYFLKFHLPPKKITQFFPTCWLAHNIFWTPAPGKPIFPIVLGGSLRFGWTFGWCRHDSTPAVKPQGSVACALPMKRWRSWRPVTAFTSGLGGDGRQGEPDAPPNHGRAKRSLLLWVVGHVVTNSTKGP